MKLDLTIDEVRELVQILESYLTETYSELRRTSTPDYHDEIKDRRVLLQGLVEKLQRAGSG
jgi:hypothetical protein